MNNLAVIIPALEENDYSPQGDLAPFGDISMLEWKILQLKKVVDKQLIYVSTPSNKVAKVAHAAGVKLIHRDADLSITDCLALSASRIDASHIVWASPTAPFIKPDEYRAMIDAYTSRDECYDSLITVLERREFILYQGHALNFSPDKHCARTKLKPVEIVTNGCFILPRDMMLQGRVIGQHPCLFYLDWLGSLEVNDIKAYSIATDLLSLYFLWQETGVNE